ncbi:MAG: MFS transporter [Coriobacteriales bacterium]|jgi:MFS family permease
MAETAPVYNAKRAWLVTVMVVIMATFAAIVTFRQMTVVPLMMEYFQVDIGTYGNVSALVSLFTLVGALVSGPFQAKYGPRLLMLICCILFFVSVALQIWAAYAGFPFVVFMFLNVFGTLAYGAWMTAPPVVIGAWFPAEKRGLPNSISATWISFGMLIVLTTSTPLVEMGGDSPLAWVNIWWMLFVLMIIGFVLILIFGKMPGPENSFLPKAEETGEKAKMSNSLKNSGIWMLILCFFCFGFATAAFGNYFPTYLEAPATAYTDPTTGIVTAGGGFGMDMAEANSLSSICSYVMVVMGFVWGFILNKIPNKKYNTLNLWVMIFTAIAGVIMFDLPGSGAVIAYMFFYGIVSRLFPPVCFTILPEICKNQEEVSMGTGVLSLVSNLIGTLATSICGTMVAVTSNWNSLFWPNLFFGIVGLVAAIALMPIYRKKFAAKHQLDAVAE